MKYKKEIKKELTKNEYSKFIKKVLNYNQDNGKLAEFIKIGDIKVYKNEYIETIENVNKFILQNGREPEKITIYQKRHT